MIMVIRSSERIFNPSRYNGMSYQNDHCGIYKVNKHCYSYSAFFVLTRFAVLINYWLSKEEY